MNHPKRLFIPSLILGIMGFVLVLGFSTVFAAGTIDVNTADDELNTDGDCSLREAVQSANTDTAVDACVLDGTPPYTINLDAETYVLSIAGNDEDANATGDLDILTSLNIAGVDSDSTYIQASASSAIIGIDRVIHITGTTDVTLSGLTIQFGNVAADESGGGVANTGSGTVTINNSTIANNFSNGAAANQGGGGLYNEGGTLAISNSIIISNTAAGAAGSGGGILNVGGTLSVADTVISANSAVRAGGGIEDNASGTPTNTTLTNVTLSNNIANAAPGNGGGMHITGPGAASITGGSVSDNFAAREGGGLWNGSATMVISGTAIFANTASGPDSHDGGGGIFNNGGTLNVTNANINSNDADGAAGSGGGILNLGGTLSVADSSITDNTAVRAGGGIEDNAVETTATNTSLSNVTLDNNSTGAAPGNGGGMHITGPGTASITGGSVSDNTAAREGGGLWNGSATMTVSGTAISGNTASGPDSHDGGGGLFNNGGTLNVSGATISNNDADGAAGSGGGILNLGGTLSVSDSSITSNTAVRAGGGIEDNAVETTATNTTLSNVTLDNNSTGAAPGNGGGMHITGPGTASITGGSASGNTAAREGGGLWNGSGGMTIDGMTINGNTASGAAADDGGGGVFNNTGTITMTNSTVSNNVADGASGSGGGILNLEGNLSVTDSMISNNSSNRAGGGIEDNAGTLITLDGVTLTYNSTGSAPGNGGGLHITGAGTVNVSASSVAYNTAAAEGGGLWNSSTGVLTVDQSTIYNNSASGTDADQGGGGVFTIGGTTAVYNSTISQNSATTAGGGVLNVDSGSTSLINVTIYENSADGGAGGVDNMSGSVDLSNSIVAHVDATGDDCAGTISVASAPNLASDSSCGASIVDDPKLAPLADYGGATETHGLLVGSPAIDAGADAICNAAPINAVDQRGESRPDGSACDLGAFEGEVSFTYYMPLIFND